MNANRELVGLCSEFVRPIAGSVPLLLMQDSARNRNRQYQSRTFIGLAFNADGPVD
jgi:hypothetical protein